MRQGEVWEVAGPDQAVNARLNGKTIQLWADSSGEKAKLGLMPVSVFAKPGNRTLELLDAEGMVIDQLQIVVIDSHYSKQNIVIPKAISRLAPSLGETEIVNNFRQKTTPERKWQPPFQQPVEGCVTSPFGVLRYHNGKPTGDYHAGLDQRGPAGTPIRAIAAGKVRIVRKFNLRGGTVAIDHGQGVQSIYLHMSKFASEEGQQVDKGDVVGFIGSTGRSTAPHLHWTMYVNGQPVNPLQWMKIATCPEKVGARKPTLSQTRPR